MRTRNTYPDSFKQEAVAMVIDSERSVQEVASSLGHSPSALARWVRLERSKPGGSVATKTTMNDE